MLAYRPADEIELRTEKARVAELLSPELREYVTRDDEPVLIEYPVLSYPDKMKSVGFDKSPELTGELKGVKGQYLIFDQGRVMNIRKHGGYLVDVRIF